VLETLFDLPDAIVVSHGPLAEIAPALDHSPLKIEL
jgi:hypothetical protein